MAGIKSLRKLTLGREASSGTAVNATTHWRGVGTIEDTRVTTFPEEDVGYISGLDRSYQPALGAMLAMESTPATFEQVLHILDAGVKLVDTGASDGGAGASGKIYTYTFPKTSKNSIKSNAFLGMDLSVKTGWVPVMAANGQLYFAFAKITQPEVLLNITFEHDSHGGDQKAAWRAGTSKLVRLNFPGSTLGTAGTGFTTKVLRIDLAGRWEKFEKLGEENGNDVLTGTFRARYNATQAAFAEIKMVNKLPPVP